MGDDRQLLVLVSCHTPTPNLPRNQSHRRCLCAPQGHTRWNCHQKTLMTMMTMTLIMPVRKKTCTCIQYRYRSSFTIHIYPYRQCISQCFLPMRKPWMKNDDDQHLWPSAPPPHYHYRIVLPEKKQSIGILTLSIRVTYNSIQKNALTDKMNEGNLPRWNAEDCLGHRCEERERGEGLSSENWKSVSSSGTATGK